jgi:hypothetical protein
MADLNQKAVSFFGWIPNAKIGVEADLDVKLSATRQVLYTDNQTVTVTGQVKTNLAVTSATVKVDIITIPQLGLVENLLNTTYTFAEDTYVSLDTIAGQALTFTTTTLNPYAAQITVSGGTPTVQTLIFHNGFQIISSGDGSTAGGTFTTLQQDELALILEATGAESVTLYPTDGGQFTVDGVVDTEQYGSRLFDDGQRSFRMLKVYLEVSDYQTPKTNDEIEITSRDGGQEERWTLTDFTPDDGGGWDLTYIRYVDIDRVPAIARRQN